MPAVYHNSDVDFLVVVKNEVPNSRQGSVRLRRALNDIFMPMDILVVKEEHFSRLLEVDGLIYKEAVQSGRVVYEENG